MESQTLNWLSTGASAVILDVQGDIDLKRRLLALGFRAGGHISMLRKASFSGPLHVRVGSTEVMVRRCDALAIHLVPILPAGLL